jgi:hypothetical protein
VTPEEQKPALEDWEVDRVLREAIRELRSKSKPHDREIAEARIASNSGYPLWAVVEVLERHPDKFEITEVLGPPINFSDGRSLRNVINTHLELNPAFRSQLLAEERAAETVKLTGLWARVVRELDRKTVDGVVLIVPHRDTTRSELFRARFDFVEDGPDVRLWFTCQTRSPAAWLKIQGDAECLGPNDALPLRPAEPAAAAFTPLLVQRFATIEGCVQRARDVFHAMLQIPDDRIEAYVNRADFHAGATRESLEFQAKRIGSRAYRPGGPRRFPITYCDRCGLPLSDPISVAYGVGPACRRYYGLDVLAAVKRWRPGKLRSSGLKPVDWIQAATSDVWEHQGPPL